MQQQQQPTLLFSRAQRTFCLTVKETHLAAIMGLICVQSIGLHCFWMRRRKVCRTHECIHVHMLVWRCTFHVYVQMWVLVCAPEALRQAKTITSCLHKRPDQRRFLLPNWPWNSPPRTPFTTLQKEADSRRTGTQDCCHIAALNPQLVWL